MHTQSHVFKNKKQHSNGSTCHHAAELRSTFPAGYLSKINGWLLHLKFVLQYWQCWFTVTIVPQLFIDNFGSLALQMKPKREKTLHKTLRGEAGIF